MSESAPNQNRPSGRTKSAFPGADGDVGFSSPMLEKINRLLVNSDADSWSIGGDDLTPESRFVRPRNVYEQVLVRDIPNGSLVLHYSQPTSSQYVPGGYTLAPLGPPNYTVEVRDRVFDADKLVDPKTAANFRGKRCDIIASGDIAKSLYLQIKETIKSHVKLRRKEFEETSRKLSEDIIRRVEASHIAEWEKFEVATKEDNDVKFITEFDGLLVEIGKYTKDWENTFRIVFTKRKLSYDKTSQSLARTCFKKLEEMEQDCQLYALSDTLSGLGLE